MTGGGKKERGEEEAARSLAPTAHPLSVRWEGKLKYFGAGVSVFHTSNDLFYPVHIHPFTPRAA